ncbi:MAG: type II toxin-antitoxin system RelB/DinJ family antitoxin [Firmicutes bacterium]|jgi:addiction module RelB/DinJ family antitoxin|nr:type II toxin-antitoxin system RelB/DinJ family antitoxin [Bacillota bacterium]
MSKEAIVQIRMDAEMKETVEELYRDLGTSFPEAVRIFAAQSIYEKGYPFRPRILKGEKKSMRGSLAQYADPKLREREENAFRKAMEEKHAKTD